ncbi:MAG: methyltransferase [Micavibrio sp.]|nr:MAG: methyltransferase [Micavibrio sp.]
MSCDYRGDGFGTKGKSLKFMEDEKFQAAWDETAERHKITTGEDAPDIRWRAHTALWAAQNGLQLDGDFVECGVFSGILSLMICKYFDFSAFGERRFWLFDTWEGIPPEKISDREKQTAADYNKSYYHKDGVYEAVTESFFPYPNVHMVQGILPDTLDQAEIGTIAYLSMDLNNATYEKACIEKLWPKLAEGAIVLLDDYGFSAFRPQQDMWDDFAAEKGLKVLTLPTGQGILVKHSG